MSPSLLIRDTRALIAAASLAVAAGLAPAVWASALSVPDGRGGTLVVWEERRRGSDDLYAQRLNASGAPIWPDTGVAVCRFPSEQKSTALVADGSGGAIITWIDSRGQYSKIFAQHVDSTGTVAWGDDGVIAAPDGVIQHDPQLTNDGAGGAIITWQDDYGSDADIRAQHMDAFGVAAWGAAGFPVCTAQFFQWYPTICSDGAGGAIITWMDPRNHVTNDWDIYAQRVSSNGSAVWIVNGIPLCAVGGRQDDPCIVADGSGGAIVAWEDQRLGGANSDLYAQRITAGGATLWTGNGAVIVSVGGHQIASSITADGSGGLIAAWQDQRAASHYDVYAQRLDAVGVPVWAANGVALGTLAGDQLLPWIAGDGTGGAWVGWQDRRDGAEFDVFAQHITAAGAVLLSANGAPVVTSNGDQVGVRAMPDGAGGAVLLWLDGRAGDPMLDVYAQRLGATGVTLWPDNGAGAYVAPGIQFAPLALSTDDGVVLAWRQKHDGEYDVYAEAFDSNGALRWPPVVACDAPGNQAPEAIVSDGAGGAIIVWTDPRAGNANADIFAARVADDGSVPWAPNGVLVCGAPAVQFSAALAPDGAGGAIVAWQDRRIAGNDDVYAQRIDDSGAPTWALDGVALGAAPNAQSRPSVVAAAGGAIVAWSDARAGASNADIYAQRVDGAGTPQWTANGGLLGAEAGDDVDVALAADGAGGAIAAWVGRRGLFWRAFGQRVDGLGARLWGPNGVAMCECDSMRSRKPPAIAPDGAGGAVVAFGDKRDDTCVNSGCLDIYAQRVSALGDLLWGDGVAVVTAPEDQDEPRLVPSGAGGAIVAWRDLRSGSRPDVFAQRLDGTGQPQWPAQGVRVSDEPTRRMAPALASDNAGGAFIAWQEQRDEYRWLLGAERIDAAGARLWGGVTGVDPPAALLDFGLEGPWPNPSRGELRLAVTLPRRGAASLELVDLMGRRLAARTLEGLAPGRHVLSFDREERLAPGLYFVRLSYEGHFVARKTCVVR